MERLRNGPYLERNNPEAAARIKSLSWIADGINESEVAEAQHLVDLAVFHPEVFQRVMNLPWVQTLHTIYESYVLESIFTVAQMDTQAARDIAGMPFLRSVESWDVQAMKSIRQMSAFDLSTFQRVISHPTVRGGITDDWAKIVATLYGVGRTNPDLINKLLDVSQVSLAKRDIAAPLSGKIQLAIIRTAPGASRSMDLLEHAVRYVEGYMGEPIPVPYVAVLFENAVSGTAAGANSGTHITILPKYDIDDGSPESDFTASHLVHEVGHYYWTGNANWIDEGACNLLGSCFEHARTREPIHPSNRPSMPARNIRELEQHPEYGNAGFTCNYALGERIFMDLRRSLGAKEFRLGFQHLWRAAAIAQGTINLNGSAAGISQLYSAFALAGDAETVDRVVRRWYDGSADYDTRYLDTSPVDPRLPSVNGRIDAAFMSTASMGPEINQFSSALVNDFVWLNLRFSYRLAAGSRVVPLDIVEYYEDGFVFHRRNWGLIAESRYTGGTKGFGVGRAAPARWAPGRYLVYVYESDRKVAQVEFTVTP